MKGNCLRDKGGERFFYGKEEEREHQEGQQQGEEDGC